MAAIKVRLVSGLAGCPADHRLTVTGMGLKKFNSEKVLPDTPATHGMIRKVHYLVSWQKVDDAPPGPRKARTAAKAQAPKAPKVKTPKVERQA
jgi:large subunit ribosomal protein L30